MNISAKYHQNRSI